MIQINNVQKSFGDKLILNGININIKKGESVAIIGNSGCGKSTLLRLLLGIQRVDSGQILVEGQDISLLNDAGLQALRLKFGILFQSSALFDSMTIGENVAFTLQENFNHSKRFIDKRVTEVLGLVEMDGYESIMPAQLSGGQKKRVGLARAIAAEPEVMLYDEPTTGLDPILSTNIENLIVRLNEQLHTTSIIVSHQQSTILRTVDTIYMMHEGQLMAPETPKSIKTSKNDIVKKFIHGSID